MSDTPSPPETPISPPPLPEKDNLRNPTTGETQLTLTIRKVTTSQPISTESQNRPGKPLQITSSLPSTGLLNHSSRSTQFSASPGFYTPLSPTSTLPSQQPGSSYTNIGTTPTAANSTLGKNQRLSEITADLNDPDAIWYEISLRVLPLFNGRGISGAIEDLNRLVRYNQPYLPVIKITETI